MAISGLIAGGINEAIADVEERRIKEAIRLQQEQQAAAQLQLQRDQQAALERERLADREFRTGQVARQDAEGLAADLAPGQITPAQAATLALSPRTAGRVTERKIIDASPIAGTAPLDASGPQQFPVLEPTREQGEQQYKKIRLQELSKVLSGATTEQQRRAIGAEALGEQINVPANLLGPTQGELLEREIAGEQRANAEADRRANAAEARMRNRPTKGGLSDLSAAETAAVFKLQDDFARDSKPFVLVRDAYQRVHTSARNPDAAGDLGLIFGYMKMLDPQSVVRETEFANAQNAAGVPDQIRNLWNRVKSGERLNPNQRAQFVGQADKYFQDAVRNQDQVVRQYTGRSSNLGINPKYVVEDLNTGLGTDDQGPPAPGAGGAAAPSAYELYLQRQRGGG